MAYFPSFLLYLTLTLSSLIISLTAATASSGTIERTTKQYIIATVPPGTTADTPQPPFLISPSGKYAASLQRHKTALGAGGFGNDFCYVQIEETETGQSEWESECMPVTDANACTLAFTDDGLEMFDGSNSVWSTEADGDHVVELTLVDQGDMRIVDKDGELAWKASDVPRANQGCGKAGSAGLAPESPPFADVIGANGNGPFGQPMAATAVNGQQLPVGDSTESAVLPGVGEEEGQQSLGFSSQPLVDSSPYDSGSWREKWSSGLGIALAILLMMADIFL